MAECASGMGQKGSYVKLASVPNKCRGGDCASGMEHIRKIIRAVATTVMWLQQQLIITAVISPGELVKRECR
jgi:hypothetical protein